jgi:hypothetical protein
MLAFMACGKTKDNTELVVTVWSDFAVPTEMDEIRIQVEGNEQTVDHPFQLSNNHDAGTYQIPVQLGLVPAGQKDLSVSITAIGLYQSTNIISQKAVLSFIPDQAHELVLYLAKSCKNVTCSDSNYTCENGDCTKPVAVNAATLGIYTAGEVESALDAGMVTDSATTASGGKSGSGGITGSGGMISSGGMNSTEGTADTGGTTSTGGVNASFSASWSALGSGMYSAVTSLAVDPLGNLYAGGGFTIAGGAGANHVAKWDGSSWSALGSGVDDSVQTLAVDSSGNLYASGNLKLGGTTSVNDVTKWNGSSWSALGSGLDNNLSSLPGLAQVLALAFDSSGNLYAGGGFIKAGGTNANYIAKWNGSSWSALGSGMDTNVQALAVDSSGNLYAGGGFIKAGGTNANYIAKWNGSSWSALGSGMDSSVQALAVDSAGNLYAGGAFTTAGGTNANYIAKWDGSSWSTLGLGMDSPVQALAVDSAGNLYAGGSFRIAGGTNANHIAKWDGSSWSALGAGVDSAVAANVAAIAFDSSENLYAGGYFTTAGGTSANYVAVFKK